MFNVFWNIEETSKCLEVEVENYTHIVQQRFLQYNYESGIKIYISKTMTTGSENKLFLLINKL